MNKYLIGIDGGGTKTLGVIWDENHREIKRVTKGFANFNIDLLKSKENIIETIKELKEDFSGSFEIVIGISGLSGLVNPNDFSRELEKKFNSKVILIDDGYLALKSIYNKNRLPVILVISGTGSIVYCLKDNKQHRFGGHGHILGDEGSAYDVSIKAFKKIINELDFNDKETEFTKMMLKKINISNVDEIKRLVYQNPKNEVAKYAVLVNELSKVNIEAKKIITTSAKSLSQQIILATKKMNIRSQYILALRGGMVENSGLFKETLLTELSLNKQEFIIDEENKEPVYGALNIKENN